MSMEEKNFVLSVDLNDRPLKRVEKMSAHERPTLHRAFSVFLINGNKILIQRRAKTKYHSPSLWANACCSHPLSEDIISEAKTRLSQELGIEGEVDLKEAFSFIYFSKLGTLFEYEFDHVLVGQYSGKIKLNPSEADKFRWVEIEKLEKELVRHPKKFAPWFLICAPMLIKKLANCEL